MLKLELTGEQLLELFKSDQFSEFIDKSVRKVLSEKQIHGGQGDHDIMTVRECSEYLHISPGAIYAMVFRKNIPCSKKGKRLMFSRKSLQEWVESGRKPTTEEIKQSARVQFSNRNKGI